MSERRFRAVRTPEGLFLHERNTGICIFDPTQKSERWLKPLYAQVAVTQRCNMDCWWCYASSSPRGGAEWSTGELKKLAKALDAWGILGVAYGGGEPFVHPGIIEVIKFTRENTGLDVSVTTNGYAPTEEQLLGIEGYASEVRVSIRRREDCATLRKFIGKGFECGVNLLLMKGNAERIDELMSRCIDLGINDILINSFVAAGKGAPHRLLEPTEKDVAALCEAIDRHDAATIKVSGRLATLMKKNGHEYRFVPFPATDEGEETGAEVTGRGRIVAITTDKKVKPSSLSEEAYSFGMLEELPKAYARMMCTCMPAPAAAGADAETVGCARIGRALKACRASR